VGRIFIPARGGAGVPVTQSMVMTASQTFKRGAVLIFASGGAGTVEEGSTDPTPIVGVAAEDANTKPGESLGFDDSVVARTGGSVGEISVHRANRMTIFSGRGSSNPTLTNIDEVYGIVKSGDDWIVDLTESSNTRLEVVDIDTNENIFFFKFMEAHLATP
jgi:hypothetical protein